MKTNSFKLMLLFILTSSLGWAQGPKASPAATATGKIGAATITIKYSSPSVKGRKIWGVLVPYNKAWRAGANEATTFETDKNITVEGKPLPAGKYSVFAIPGETEWKIIFNSETGQWGIKHGGDANYDVAKNILTVAVKPGKTSMNESLAYEVKSNGIVLKWETVEVPVAIK
jgi:Protein of unknown function (DUF2911)